MISVTNDSVNFSSSETEQEVAHKEDPVNEIWKGEDYQNHLYIHTQLDGEQKEAVNDTKC